MSDPTPHRPYISDAELDDIYQACVHGKYLSPDKVRLLIWRIRQLESSNHEIEAHPFRAWWASLFA